ncbi:MAG: hypothetical protein ACTSQ8_07970 [Candidatus Helarchaeota archaeon]
MNEIKKLARNEKMDISIDIIINNAHYTITTTDWETAERFLKQFEPEKFHLEADGVPCYKCKHLIGTSCELVGCVKGNKWEPKEDEKTCDNCKYGFFGKCPFIDECVNHDMWAPREVEK